MNGSKMDHDPNCRRRREYQFTGKYGDLMVSCRDCKRWRVLERADVVEQPEPEPVEAEPQPERVSSRYVCREHLEPVTWQGRGCGACARRRRRPKVRSAQEVSA